MGNQHLDAKHRQTLLKKEDVGAQTVRGRLLHGDLVERDVGQGKPRLAGALPAEVQIPAMGEPAAGDPHPGRTRAFPVEALPEDLCDPVLDPLVERGFRGAKAMTFMCEVR
jgi:hypothetical protein